MALSAARALAALLCLGVPRLVQAQGAGAPIRDNSFLVEEAYNQDRNVTQHIANFAETRDGDWAFTFTDEWPMGSVRDQLSVGMVLLDADATGDIGALAFNYRRQVIGNPEAAVIVSPG